MTKHPAPRARGPGAPARRMILLLTALAAAGAQAAPADFRNRQVGQISSAEAANDCLFFTLQGVTQADSLVPYEPWFAVPRSHPGQAEIFTQLAMAKVTGLPVMVRTRNTLSCGYISVDYVVVG